jgi:hypothetical protein
MIPGDTPDDIERIYRLRAALVTISLGAGPGATVAREALDADTQFRDERWRWRSGTDYEPQEK